MNTLTPRLDILPTAQRRLWDEFRDGLPSSFVLYGGTALALRTGSRESEDFDFFTNEALDAHALRATLPFLIDADLAGATRRAQSIAVHKEQLATGHPSHCPERRHGDRVNIGNREIGLERQEPQETCMLPLGKAIPAAASRIAVLSISGAAPPERSRVRVILRRMMRIKLILLTVLMTLAATPAFATWSVVALDRKTGSLVIASATCVTGQGLASRGGLKSIQAVVVPGKGIAAAQAGVDGTRANQMLIFRELEKGTAPADIIALLKADPRIESRQFGILDLQGRMAGFSGATNGATSLDVQGQVPGTDIFYSIQGNILANAAVVNDAVTAFIANTGVLTDRVMAAMEAADRNGGDSRCSCARGPQTAATAVCESRTAYVAYILRAETGDKNGEAHSDGQYAMFLDVTDANTQATENSNPVKTLRLRYDAYMKAKAGGTHER